jgi:hypothetical protein
MVSVQDVVTRVRRTFGDEAGIQITLSDIYRWINDAQREAVMQNEGLLMTTGYVDSVAGTQEYALPLNLYVLHHAYFRESTTSAYYSLKWMPLKDFSEYLAGWDGSTYQGIPLVFTQQQDGQFVVFPKPQASVADGFKFIYSRYPVDIVDINSSIDLPPFLHSFVINFCLMQAYELDEDWESAGRKATQIQGDLDFNNNREFWFGRDSYPVISVGKADQEIDLDVY